jgi:hypothetical protein
MQLLVLCALLVSLFAVSSATEYEYCRCIPRPAHYLRGLEEAAPERNLIYTYKPVCVTSPYWKNTL